MMFFTYKDSLIFYRGQTNVQSFPRWTAIAENVSPNSLSVFMKHNICETFTPLLCLIKNTSDGQKINIHLLTDAVWEQLHILQKAG